MAVQIVQGLSVNDLDRDEILSLISSYFAQIDGLAFLSKCVFSLHVSSLLFLDDPKYLQSISTADLLYADGVSISLLARMAGAKKINRFPLTDLGHEVICSANRLLQKEVRIGLIGGPEELAINAGLALQKLHSCRIVFSKSGFDINWKQIEREVEEYKPHIIFVGLGTPLETKVIAENIRSWDNVIVMTCGGWFGFLAGNEKRAPRILRYFGFEWIFRLLQDPKRLLYRYSRGSLRFASIAIQILMRRMVTALGRKR